MNIKKEVTAIEKEDLSFKGNDPGCVKYGNFINYYQFHPPENRMKIFPSKIWKAFSNKENFVGLDIGSNTGNLTQELYKFLQENITNTKCYLLGVDIDPPFKLIADQNNLFKDHVSYESMNFMETSQINNLITPYLKKFNRTTFDVIFCFSVTMWIHLNYGDDGLQLFLKTICELSEMVVIEPQPWKCYKSASRRLKRSANSTFPLFNELKYRENVEMFIEEFFKSECNFEKVTETPTTEWGRKIIVYKRRI